MGISVIAVVYGMGTLFNTSSQNRQETTAVIRRPGAMPRRSTWPSPSRRLVVHPRTACRSRPTRVPISPSIGALPVEQHDDPAVPNRGHHGDRTPRARPRSSPSWSVRREPRPALAGEPGEDGSALVLALLFLTVSGGRGERVARLRDHELERDDRRAIGARLRLRRAVGHAGRGSRRSAWARPKASPATASTAATPRRGRSTTRASRYESTASRNRARRPNARVVLSVCPSSVSAPCPDGKSLLRADVIFYDDGSFGRAVGVQTWSNQ